MMPDTSGFEGVQPVVEGLGHVGYRIPQQFLRLAVPPLVFHMGSSMLELRASIM